MLAPPTTGGLIADIRDAGDVVGSLAMPPRAVADHSENSSLVTILGLLRAEAAMTRPQLIAATGFGRRVVAQRVDDLIASGLANEGGPEASTGGRPASTVRFRPEAGVILVAEVSPSVVRTGYCDLGGRLVNWSEEAVTAELGPEAILERVQVSWDHLLREPELQHVPLMAIGIGVIGPVDTDHIGRSPVVTPFGWNGAHVRERLTSRYGVPVWADNEVNMMALAEYRFHADPRPSDLVLLLVDGGIGAGLISNGRLHRGADGIAGELGHVTVEDHGAGRCWCGKTGCLTQIASTGAIERDLGFGLFDSPLAVGRRGTPGSDLAALLARDPAARRRFEVAGEATGRVLADFVNMFNPSEIVIGGRVASAGEPFLGPLRRSLEERSFAASAAHVRLATTSRENELGLIGAGIMAADGFLGVEFASRWLASGN